MLIYTMVTVLKYPFFVVLDTPWHVVNEVCDLGFVESSCRSRWSSSYL